MPRGDEIVTRWKVQWQNLTADQATWEDKHFIKLTFPEFYRKTIQEWWPDNSSCGQERAQGGGGQNCQEQKMDRGDWRQPDEDAIN
jgi:hypothetical protein